MRLYDVGLFPGTAAECMIINRYNRLFRGTALHHANSEYQFCNTFSGKDSDRYRTHRPCVPTCRNKLYSPGTIHIINFTLQICSFH